MPRLRGSFWVLVLYDVAEQIELERLREILGVSVPGREPSFKHPAPQYVRFERPPVVEDLEPLETAAGERFQCRVKYFDYGVISVELQTPFEADWSDLVRISNRWINAPDLERCTAEVVRSRLDRVGKSLTQPYPSWLSEDYYMIHIAEACDETGAPMAGGEMLAEHGTEIAQIVRGDSGPLAEAERAEALQSSLSYYTTDLLVVGWVAALIYDTPEGAAPAEQLLEYANTQLLEFRHYDDLLTKNLDHLYALIERRGGVLRRWRTAREAGHLNAVRLEVMELSERTDTAIKFLSDMFYARAYRLAAARVGVTDYRNLVERKLRIAGDLYEFIMNEFYQSRSFILEAMVVAILVIELIHLFRAGI